MVTLLSLFRVPVQQVRDDLRYLSKHGVKIDEFWLDVERSDWGSDHAWNTDFILKMADEAKKHTKAKVGVYTSESQWTPITGGSHRLKHLPLWWATYDGTPDFAGFRRFGGWKKPYMHQYVGIDRCCLCWAGIHTCLRVRVCACAPFPGTRVLKICVARVWMSTGRSRASVAVGAVLRFRFSHIPAEEKLCFLSSDHQTDDGMPRATCSHSGC